MLRTLLIAALACLPARPALAIEEGDGFTASNGAHYTITAKLGGDGGARSAYELTRSDCTRDCSVVMLAFRDNHVQDSRIAFPELVEKASNLGSPHIRFESPRIFEAQVANETVRFSLAEPVAKAVSHRANIVLGGDPETYVALAEQMHSAADHLTRAGIVNLDIKPSNFLIDGPLRPGTTGVLRMADLEGLAPLGATYKEVLLEGKYVLSTLGFQAPELYAALHDPGKTLTLTGKEMNWSIAMSLVSMRLGVSTPLFTEGENHVSPDTYMKRVNDLKQRFFRVIDAQIAGHREKGESAKEAHARRFREIVANGLETSPQRRKSFAPAGSLTVEAIEARRQALAPLRALSRTSGLRLQFVGSGALAKLDPTGVGALDLRQKIRLLARANPSHLGDIAVAPGRPGALTDNGAALYDSILADLANEQLAVLRTKDRPVLMRALIRNDMPFLKEGSPHWNFLTSLLADATHMVTQLPNSPAKQVSLSQLRLATQEVFGNRRFDAGREIQAKVAERQRHLALLKSDNARIAEEAIDATDSWRIIKYLRKKLGLWPKNAKNGRPLAEALHFVDASTFALRAHVEAHQKRCLGSVLDAVAGAAP